ncbi:MAG: bifunctional orotidine-5'-phosphate decarboxylase/orotate phosphoribosyltransferase [Pegethrix bostrychoides GSE-TBD4-15B]|jgi:uridine monophosphate synthetase|uniref:Orotate phosphoribosyltransferase n=1 Tax=Pegethrix bostrychoides GSE-TBD4-15B TaxID=2839662 RepID=A0A951PB74_9CYAN|nr:bifunctional orotidine-5'-phosphate decarboxylase/orotate phosphoribosyltransferase [Pegethrix bostrychoides GSE-TBD4-15B]
MDFSTKLAAAVAQNQSLLSVGLDPNPELLPQQFQSCSLTQRLFNWLEFVIAQTADQVCAYKPTLGFYQALGAPGLELLQQVLAIIPPQIPVILDAKHGDLNSSSLIANMLFEQWRVDAVTLSAYAGQDGVAPFLVYPGKLAFVLCCTSNPSAVALQQFGQQFGAEPLYLQIAKAAQTWGTPEQVGLEVGTGSPELLRQMRKLAPERLILVRSIWQAEVDLPELIGAGLDANGEGLLIPVPQDWLSQADLASSVQKLRVEVNQIRAEAVSPIAPQIPVGAACDLWSSNLCTLNPHPHLDLILQLYDVGCILFGEFVQASGATFPYYIDLRKIISNPQLFHQVLTAYAEILAGLKFDRIAGIPYGSLPTATGLSLRLNHPMIFPRKEVKAHGTRRLIEGHFQPGETVVVVDDVLISGNSAIEGAEKLKSAGLEVQDIVVLLDHEQGVKDRLRQAGFNAYAVLTLSEVIDTLYQAGRMNETQYQAFASEDPD